MGQFQALQSTQQSAYEVHISVFDGPLALLLQLIEKNELDITKVALAQVTDAFMDEVDRMRADMAIEVVADFLAVAAKLLWIKSRALLPKSPISRAAKDSEDDIGDELIRQLRAYRQYKDAAAWLRERDQNDLRAYVRGHLIPRPTRVTLDVSNLTVAALRAAAETALFPSDTPRPEGAIQKPRLSILDQVKLIRERFQHWTHLTFQRLLSQTPSRLEAVVTLQAILELMKQQAVAAKQENLFGDITIEMIGPFPRDIESGLAGD